MSLFTSFRSSTGIGYRHLHISRPVCAIYNNICETIGNTPVVKLNSIAPKNVEMYVKCEYFNPLSSVKDRLALGIITDAEKRGVLKPGMTVIEATSGNTGIALAMVCAQRGYKFVSTMAESFSIERRKVMRALGAKVILTPMSKGGFGMVKKAEELAQANGWFLASQFETDANWKFHAQTTGPEILRDFAGRNLDYFVTGYGTGGTFTGVGKVLKAARPDVKIVLSEPMSASMVTSGVPQKRNSQNAPAEGHPAFAPHAVQGWAPNFIPYVLQNGLDEKLADEIQIIDPVQSMALAHELASKEGIFTGTSGGATLAAALQAAKNAKDGSVFLVMLPDTMERYLSTPLFATIEADMNAEERQISESTPGYQLDA